MLLIFWGSSPVGLAVPVPDVPVVVEPVDDGWVDDPPHGFGNGCVFSVPAWP